jgi:membrane protein DedA with SNARE-associated domain
MDSHFFQQLIQEYGLYAVFVLAMIEGDITLLIAGVLAHNAFFGDYSFPKVVGAATLGAVTSDCLAYAAGRGFSKSMRRFSFYKMAHPRIERLTIKFGPLSMFLSKYIYGIRTASCVFHGVGHMRYMRFAFLTLASCFLWVFILTSAGYFFSGAITKVLGDFHQLGIYLLVIVVLGILGFYLVERLWLSKKVEEVDIERIHELEHAVEKLHHIGHEIQERIHLPPLSQRGKDSRRRSKEIQKEEP